MKATWKVPVIALALLLSSWLLSSCALLPPRGGENGTVLMGVRVLYVLKNRENFAFCPPDRVGCTVPLGSVCVVQLDKAYFERSSARNKVLLVAHEIGHCLDFRKLSLSHGGFRYEGGRWGAYWSSPFEGFAEAYGRAYLKKCGPDLDSLGWMNARGSCTLPDPHLVTPQLVQRLGL